jgi:hypothetical protein
MTQNVGTNYEAVTWVKTNFFSFSLLLEEIKNYRGMLVENVKKVKNQPTLRYIVVRVLACNLELVLVDL